MRALIRFSLDDDKNSELRNKLAKILVDDYGFVKHGKNTATYEHADITKPKLKVVMDRFWKQAVKSTNVAEIDHVWMYCDNPPTAAKKSAEGKGGK